jgi:general secretion pathway protein G
MKHFSAIFILISFLMGCSNSVTSSPGKVVKDFWQAALNSEVSLVCEMLSGKGVDHPCYNEEIRKMFQELAEHIKEDGGINEIKVINEEVSGEVATTKYQLTLGNGKKLDDEAKLIKEDNKWKLTNPSIHISLEVQSPLKKKKNARAQIEMFGTALDTYKLDVGNYPTSLNQLIETGQKKISNWDGPYLAKKVIPKDPWGNDYVYKYPGENAEYDLSSYGNDGKVGGEGLNRDINSWEVDYD